MYNDFDEFKLTNHLFVRYDNVIFNYISVFILTYFKSFHQVQMGF